MKKKWKTSNMLLFKSLIIFSLTILSLNNASAQKNLKAKTVVIESQLHKAFTIPQYRFIAEELKTKQFLIDVVIPSQDTLMKLDSAHIAEQEKVINDLRHKSIIQNEQIDIANQKFSEFSVYHQNIVTSYKKESNDWKKKALKWKIIAGGIAIASGFLLTR